MTGDSSRAEDLFSALRQVQPTLETPSQVARRRRSVVARLEELALERVTNRRLSRRWRVWGTVALAAAVILCLGLGWMVRDRVQSVPSRVAAATVLSVSGTVNVLHEGRARTLTGSGEAQLGTYDVLEASARSQARLLSRRGVLVGLSPLSSMRFVVGPQQSELAERIELLAGRVDVEVPEGAVRESFSVRTPTALVLVHGTRFSVELTHNPDAEQPVTSVHVTRGRVLVQHDRTRIQLEAGSTWSSAGAARESTDSTAQPWSAAPAADAPQPAEAPSVDPLPRGGSRPGAPPTTLAEVNRLYGAAMAAKRAGRDEVAIRHLEELLARFPDASLAPNARVERFRALARLGKRDAAAGSARQYLDRHPDGFASAEARSVANGAQPSGPQPK